MHYFKKITKKKRLLFTATSNQKNQKPKKNIPQNLIPTFDIFNCYFFKALSETASI